ncbi:MAG: hypothetical protein ABUK01_15135 [Leptospirales bacterium]
MPDKFLVGYGLDDKEPTRTCLLLVISTYRERNSRTIACYFFPLVVVGCIPHYVTCGIYYLYFTGFVGSSPACSFSFFS